MKNSMTYLSASLRPATITLTPDELVKIYDIGVSGLKLNILPGQ